MENKKQPQKDVHRYNKLLLSLGLFVSLAIVTMAFEWRSYERLTLIEPEALSYQDDWQPPVTIPEPPKPKPKPIIAKPIPVPDDQEIDEPEDIVMDIDEIGEIDIPDIPEPDKEEAEEPPVDPYAVEVAPEPKGGYQAFYKFLTKNLKYPAAARKLGIEGKVYAQFVVDKDGKITNIQILRGIGAGCDEEVLRLLDMAPAWKPGKQRGNPVRVRMVVPVNFQLTN